MLNIDFMPSHQNNNVNVKTCYVLIGGLFIGHLIGTIIFIDHFTINYPLMDNWRIFKVVVTPLIEGKFRLYHLWSDPIHPDVKRAVIALINYSFFNLSYRFEALVGFLFSVSSFVLIMVNVRRSMEKWAAFQSLILIFLIYFSFKDIGYYLNPVRLVSNTSYIFLFALPLMLDKYFSSWRLQYLISFSVLVFLIFFCSYDFAMILSVTVIFVILITGLIDRNIKYLIPIFPIVVSYFIYTLFYRQVILPNLPQEFDKFITYNNVGNGLFDRVVSVLVAPGYIIESISNSLANGIVNFSLLATNYGVNYFYGTILGFILLIFYVFILTRYLQSRSYRISLAPFVLTVFVIVFTMAVIVFRQPPSEGIEYPLFDLRYGKAQSFFTIGLIWISGMLFYQKTKINYSCFILIFIAFFVAFEVFYFTNVYGKLKNVENEHGINEKSIYLQGLKEIPHEKYSYFGGNFPALQSLELMKNNNLSVFNKDYNRSPLFNEYIQARQRYSRFQNQEFNLVENLSIDENFITKYQKYTTSQKGFSNRMAYGIAPHKGCRVYKIKIEKENIAKEDAPLVILVYLKDQCIKKSKPGGYQMNFDYIEIPAMSEPYKIMLAYGDCKIKNIRIDAVELDHNVVF